MQRMMSSRTYVYIRVHMRLFFAYMRVPTRTYAEVFSHMYVGVVYALCVAHFTVAEVSTRFFLCGYLSCLFVYLPALLMITMRVDSK